MISEDQLDGYFDALWAHARAGSGKQIDKLCKKLPNQVVEALLSQ